MNKRILSVVVVTAFIGFTVSSCGHHGERGHRGSSAVNHKFERMDENKDGVITSAEHAATAAKSFEEMDENKDGKVNMEELKAHMKERWKRYHRPEGKPHHKHRHK